MLRISQDGKKTTLLASWVSWYLAHGVLPEQNLLHVCDTPACIKPSHLFEGSQADNMYDSAVKAAGGVLVEVPEVRYVANVPLALQAVAPVGADR
jgi:hypothetical protein